MINISQQKEAWVKAVAGMIRARAARLEITIAEEDQRAVEMTAELCFSKGFSPIDSVEFAFTFEEINPSLDEATAMARREKIEAKYESFSIQLKETKMKTFTSKYTWGTAAALISRAVRELDTCAATVPDLHKRLTLRDWIPELRGLAADLGTGLEEAGSSVLTLGVDAPAQHRYFMFAAENLELFSTAYLFLQKTYPEFTLAVDFSGTAEKRTIEVYAVYASESDWKVKFSDAALRLGSFIEGWKAGRGD